MGLPSKRRTSRSKRERARHHSVAAITLRIDEDGTVHRPHHASPTTGKYRGRNAVPAAKGSTRAKAKKA